MPAPTDEEIAQILAQIDERVTRLLRRCGRRPQDPSPTDPVAEQMPLLAGYTAASIQERIATGPRSGREGALGGEPAPSPSPPEPQHHPSPRGPDDSPGRP